MIPICQWLTKYQTLQRAIDYLEFEIDDYEPELKCWVSGDLYNLRIVKGLLGAKLEDIIKDKQEELKVLQNRKQKLLDFNYKFDDLNSQILIKRYFEDKKLFAIAEELNCSESTVYKKHSELVKLIQFVDSNFVN